MERINGLFCDSREILFSDCDMFLRMKPSVMLRGMTDLAGADYTEKGLSYLKLREIGVAFLVSRVHIQILRPVTESEQITFATAEQRMDGPYWIRDHLLKNAMGETVVAAKSTWITVDPKSHRIVRSSALPFSITPSDDHAPHCPEAEKLTVPVEPEHVGTRRVVFSDLDGNGHINNGVYADIACDYLPLSVLERGIADMTINFHREAMLGADIDIYYHAAGTQHFVVGKLENKLCFAVRLTERVQEPCA